MPVSRRAFLATQGAALGALLAPRSLLAAVEAATPATPKLDSWDDVRKQFRLTPDYLHFAGFVIASHPTPVREAIEAYRKAIDENPFLAVEEALFEDDQKNLQTRVREAAAAYLGGKADEVAITQSTTTGLALIYNGLWLKPGEEFLATEHDHNAHHTAIKLSAARSGASFRRIALFDEAATATADGIVRRIEAGIRPETRVLGVTWVHSQSGIRLPIRRIADALAKVNAGRDPASRIALVVDGVHGFGCVDESVAEMGADYFAAGTHKWIFGPRGTGIAWAKQEAWARLKPSVPSFSDREVFRAWTENREPKTPNNARRMTPGGFQAYDHQWAMVAAFKMHEQLGRARVAGRVAELNGRIKDGLAKIPKVRVHTPRDPALSGGIVCFEVDGQTPKDVVKNLLAKRVVGSTSPYAKQYARLSAGIFNSPAEVDQAVAALRTSVS